MLIWILLAGFVASGPALAQQPRIRSPRRGVAQDRGPRPPPLDGADFDDTTEDEFEMGDQPNRMNPPPPPPPPAAAPPPVNDFRPSTPLNSGEPGKLHFKVVEGQFWEKGKRRGRATDANRKQDTDRSTQSVH
jgi:hypothetical protein